MAKFKVGDVVSVKREAAEMIDNPALARKRGRVTKVLPGGYYEVDGELGATGLELTDAELTLANSRACNAKFKVGDRVAYYGKESALYRLRGKVSDVSRIRGETFVTVDLDNGEEWGAPEKDWGLLNSRACNSVRSRNAVVAKALNACARNASPEYGKIEDALTRMKAESLDLLRKLAALGAPVQGNEVSQVIEKILVKTRNKLFK